MSRYHCNDHPDVMALEVPVLDVRPGAVLLSVSPVFPGGGGQLMDRARIAWSGGEADVERVEITPQGVWHVAPGAETASSVVRVTVDPGFRVSRWRSATPLRAPARDTLAERLLRAGLPD